MDLNDYLRLLRRRWKRLVAALLLCVALGVAAVFTLPRSYESSARLVVQPRTATASTTTTFDNEAASYLTLAKSDGVARLVIDDLDLDLTPRQLLARLSIDLDPGTSVLNVSATDRKASTARELTQSVAISITRYLGAVSLADDGSIAPLDSAERIQRAENASPVAIVQQATTSDDPVSPRIPLVIGIAVLAGLLLGGVSAVVSERRSRLVRFATDIGHIDPDATVLAQVTVQLDADTVAGAARTADDFRRVVAALARLPRTSTARLILLTGSAGLPAGTAAYHLARAVAESGTGVTLVDADLRSPGITALLGRSAESGLSDAAQTDQVEAAHRSSLSSTLGFIASGPLAADPGGVVASARFRDLILRSTHGDDLLVVATAPIAEVADAALLARDASLVVVVAELGRTSEHELRAALDAARAAGAEPTVLLVERPSRRDTVPVETESAPEPEPRPEAVPEEPVTSPSALSDLFTSPAPTASEPSPSAAPGRRAAARRRKKG